MIIAQPYCVAPIVLPVCHRVTHCEGGNTYKLISLPCSLILPLAVCSSCNLQSKLTSLMLLGIYQWAGPSVEE